MVDIATGASHRVGMRLQLAIDVANLAEAIDFYSRLFGAEPAKVEDGYANWALSDPPLKFVVFERTDGTAGAINHLGFEVESADEVVAAEQRLRTEGLVTTGIDETMCCFAEKVETWVTDPNGHRWEIYVKTADHPTARDNVVLSHRSTTDDGAVADGAVATGSAAGASLSGVVTVDDVSAGPCCA